MIKTMLLSAMMTVLSVSAYAQDVEPLAVGDDAADFYPQNWLNRATYDTFSELKGDVVVVMAWGKDSQASVAALPQLAKWHANAAAHVITFYDQAHELADIEKTLKDAKANVPVAFDGYRQAGYIAEALPHVWVVGVEGKIIFSGNSDFAAVVDKEIAKVKYPGLDRANVHSALEPAAKAFVAGKYAEAYKLAEAVYDETTDGAAEDDADHIMRRIDSRASTLIVRAETAELTRHYQLAIACWEELATRFKGLDDAKEAATRKADLSKRKEVHAEITARKELLRLVLSLDVAYQDVDDDDLDAVLAFRRKCVDAYTKFIKANEDTGAAESAGDLVHALRQLLPVE